MTQEKQNDAIEYSLNDMRANVRTHIPDFELASKIMSELERAQRMEATLDTVIGLVSKSLSENYGGRRFICERDADDIKRICECALSDAPKEGE